MNSMTVWKFYPVQVKRKMSHQKRSALYKRNKRTGIGFCIDEGDIPVCVLQSDWMGNVKQVEVVNPRGNAYASRNQLRYFKDKRKEFKF